MKYRLLTEQEVSEWTGITVSTLQTRRSRPGRNPLPFVKLGRSIRYREDLLLKWVEQNTFDSTDGDSLNDDEY